MLRASCGHLSALLEGVQKCVKKTACSDSKCLYFKIIIAGGLELPCVRFSQVSGTIEIKHFLYSRRFKHRLTQSGASLISNQGVAGSSPGPATFFRRDLVMKNNSTTILSLPRIQEGQLSVTGESMGNKYW